MSKSLMAVGNLLNGTGIYVVLEKLFTFTSKKGCLELEGAGQPF